MSPRSLADFVRSTAQRDRGQGFFELESERLLEVNLNEREAMFVNGNDLLAFQDGIQWDVKLMRKVTGMLAGGLFNVRLDGTGLIAITSYFEPLTLQVSPGASVITDPNATVAWSGSLAAEFRSDVSLKTFVGRGSGESIQMEFKGNGFVVVQPYEEAYFQSRGGR